MTACQAPHEIKSGMWCAATEPGSDVSLTSENHVLVRIYRQGTSTCPGDDSVQHGFPVDSELLDIKAEDRDRQLDAIMVGSYAARAFKYNNLPVTSNSTVTQ